MAPLPKKGPPDQPPPVSFNQSYTVSELDFYAYLNEFDQSVGSMIAALKRLGYYDNTIIWCVLTRRHSNNRSRIF